MNENFKYPKTNNVVNQFFVAVDFNTEDTTNCGVLCVGTSNNRGILCITTTDDLETVEGKLRIDYGFFSSEEPYGEFSDFAEYVETNHADWTVTVWEPDLSVKLS